MYTNYQYSSVQNKEVDDFVLKLVHDQKVSTAAYAKPVAPVEVSQDLVHFMWACDEYQQPHPRAYPQLAFLIDIYTEMGTRPGEVIESDAWLESNEGLLYGDVDLIRLDRGEYIGYMINVRLRNRKGHRNNKKHTYVSLFLQEYHNNMTSPGLQLYENPEDRSLCPITLFLALGLADEVFEGIHSFNDLEATKIEPGDSRVRYRCKPHAKSLPIMRLIDSSGEVSERRILSYNCSYIMLKGLGQRASYEETLTGYCFRRAFARALHRMYLYAH
jgi:hypothetical protein